MNRGMSWLRKLGLRQIITVFLVAITFLVVPAFSNRQALQAQAKPVDVQVDSYEVDSGTVKRIQQRAEDLGDRSEQRGGRAIGDTGLKNIKKLGENIPETLGMRARQDFKDATGEEPSKALNKAQSKVEGAVEGTKQAVKDAID